jgi:hypothetical protein
MTLSVSGDSITFPDLSTLQTAPSGFGFKNRIINGAMVIDQRNNGAAYLSSYSGYVLDRYNFAQSPSGKLVAQQNAGAITPPSGFGNYLGFTSQSTYTVTSGDYYTVEQRVEGFNTFDLAWGTASAQTVILSFWVRSSITGTFGGAFQNSATTRSYPFTYAISAANTWEQKSITVAGDTSGTWVGASNGIGLNLILGMGVGSGYSGTAGVWASANYKGATGATSVVATSGATFYLTGVQLEKGSTATAFDYLDYGRSLIQSRSGRNVDDHCGVHINYVPHKNAYQPNGQFFHFKRAYLFSCWNGKASDNGGL